MTMHERQWNTDDEVDHELANLRPDQLVTADQLRMKPGQRLVEKAKELGVSLLTLRIWNAEWKGSQYDPDYVIQRLGHDNWLRNKWKAKDWTALVREEIGNGRSRHIGDVLFAVGLTAANTQLWSQRHAPLSTRFGSIPQVPLEGLRGLDTPPDHRGL
jgi:hypothetical protein